MRYYLLVFITWFLIGLFYIAKHPLPSGVHAWAQADRLSLAQRFTEDRPFLSPATHCLQTPDGRVGCEFPLLQWSVGKISRLFHINNHIPLLYKWCVWAFWGLMWLVLFSFICRFLKFQPRFAFLLSFFLLSSPLVLFYSHTFLLDVPAVSMVMLALYFFFSYLHTKKNITLVLCFFFAALASLFKVSAFLYLAAFAGSTFLLTFLYSRSSFFHFYSWLPYLFTLLFSAFFLYYNKFEYVQYNKDNWSFVFLSETRPLQSLLDWNAIPYAIRKWHNEVYTTIQWFILGILSFVGVILGFSSNRNRFFPSIPLGSVLFVSFYSVGLIALLYLLGKQLPDHDYYLIVLFLPLIWLAFLYFVSPLFKNDPILSSPISFVILLAVTAFSFSKSIHQQQARFAPYYQKGEVEIYTPIEWLKGADAVLDSLRVSRNDIVLVPYGFSMNIHLVYLNRTGLIVTTEEMQRDTLFMETWAKRIQADYYVLQKEWLDSFYTRNPRFQYETQCLFTNDKLAVLKVNK